MITIINILLFATILVVAYFLLDMVYTNRVSEKISKYVERKNEKYYNDIIKHYNKNNNYKLTTKLNYFHRINILIDKAGIKFGIIANPVSIIILCVLSFMCCYLLVYSVIRIILLSIVISLPGFLIPILILKIIGNYKVSRIEDSVLDFLLQLRNYTRINNDIVYAFKQVETVDPLQSYIDTFLVELNSGIKFEKAVNNIKDKISLGKLKDIITNIEHCYLYGGDFCELMRKSYVTISKIQKEKKQRIQDTKNARIVLGILIFLDLFVYFSYIKNNYQNYLLMTNRLLGIVILYWNFISIWGLLFLMNRVQKLDYWFYLVRGITKKKGEVNF